MREGTPLGALFCYLECFSCIIIHMETATGLVDFVNTRPQVLYGAIAILLIIVCMLYFGYGTKSSKPTETMADSNEFDALVDSINKKQKVVMAG